jgi:hypothetical protein
MTSKKSKWTEEERQLAKQIQHQAVAAGNPLLAGLGALQTTRGVRITKTMLATYVSYLPIARELLRIAPATKLGHSKTSKKRP